MNYYQEGKTTLLDSQVDIDTLADIRDVEIDPSLPREERKRSYLRQIRNPNLYRCGDIIVRVSYAGDGVSLVERLKQYLMMRLILAK